MAESRPINEARRNVKRSEVVAHRIAQAIASDGLIHGDRLPPESAMLSQYGVSRASLREALRMLEVQGLLNLRPGPGGGPIVGFRLNIGNELGMLSINADAEMIEDYIRYMLFLRASFRF